jgi:branched-chain amino acid transport system substrate-binding protein
MRYLQMLSGLLLACAWILPQAASAEERPFHVGVVIPLTGPAAGLGNYVKNGMELAYNQLPPEDRKRIVLHYEDDRLTPVNAVSAYQKLARSKQADAVVVIGSGIGNTIAPLAERDQRLVIALGASDPNVVKNRKYAFTHWLIPEVEIELLLDELKQRDYKKIGIIGQEQEGVVALTNVIHKLAPKYGLKDRIVLEERRLPGDYDFRTYIAKAKNLGTDAFIVMLFPGAISAFAKGVRDGNLNAALAGIELFEDANEVKAADGALLGHWYITADKATDEFEQKYLERYKSPSGWGGANGYDTLNLLAGAVRSGAVRADDVVKFLEGLKDYSGACGVYSATGDHRFTLPASVKKITENGFEMVRSGGKVTGVPQ